jgi:hypothetical protein
MTGNSWDPPAGSTLSGPPGSGVPQYAGWDPAGDGPGLEKCNAVVFHGSRNPDSAMFGQDEECENDALPGSEQCELHQYELDEPAFTTRGPGESGLT